MLYLLISCFSFILLSKSFSYKQLPQWKGKKRLFLASFWSGFSCYLISLIRKSKLAFSFFHIPVTSFSSKVENVEEKGLLTLLDLPELALNSILELLSPTELCRLAEVCSSLRDRCRSDHLWEKHMKEKWITVIGDSASKDWYSHIASRMRTSLEDKSEKNGLLDSIFSGWPFFWSRSNLEGRNKEKICLPDDSIKAWYLSLESGKLLFPAQVYNRENGHAGFMLSCYDARLFYDSETDTFQARYTPHGRLTAEENIEWERIRAPPVDTPPHVIHPSDCLTDLRPGDHIEIQWRRSKEFPYGWWYAVVGHLETCDGNVNQCHCHLNDRVILEFNQFSASSRWRRVVISRSDHWEKGSEADGFYGGIRKLYKEDEIERWKQLMFLCT